MHLELLSRVLAVHQRVLKLSTATPDCKTTIHSTVLLLLKLHVCPLPSQTRTKSLGKPLVQDRRNRNTYIQWRPDGTHRRAMGRRSRPAAVDTAKRTLSALVMSWSIFFFFWFLEPRTSLHQSLIHTTRCQIMTKPPRLSLESCTCTNIRQSVGWSKIGTCSSGTARVNTDDAASSFLS